MGEGERKKKRERAKRGSTVAVTCRMNCLKDIQRGITHQCPCPMSTLIHPRNPCRVKRLIPWREKETEREREREREREKSKSEALLLDIG